MGTVTPVMKLAASLLSRNRTAPLNSLSLSPNLPMGVAAKIFSERAVGVKRILKQKYHIENTGDIHIPAWKKQQKDLEADYERLSQEYKPIQERVKELLQIKRCVDAVIRQPKEEKRREAVKISGKHQTPQR